MTCSAMSSAQCLSSTTGSRSGRCRMMHSRSLTGGKSAMKKAFSASVTMLRTVSAASMMSVSWSLKPADCTLSSVTRARSWPMRSRMSAVPFTPSSSPTSLPSESGSYDSTQLTW